MRRSQGKGSFRHKCQTRKERCKQCSRKHFAKDKLKVMLTMKDNTVFNIEENKLSAQSEAIFDDQFEFVHRCIQFGIFCFYKKDVIEKLVKLYQFKRMFLDKIQSSEIPVIKKENANSIKEPMEYPTSVILTEAQIQKI
jgi:hypothetical protein